MRQTQSIQSISIHALREEGDRRTQYENPEPDISIHALREEGDLPPLLGYHSRA